MAPTMETFGLMKFQFRGNSITRQVQLIGVQPEQRAKTGDFAEFLFDDKGKLIPPSFEITDRVRRNTPEGSLLRDPEFAGSDDAMSRALRSELEKQVPDHGAIIGYAMATHHMGGKEPDLYIALRGPRSA